MKRGLTLLPITILVVTLFFPPWVNSQQQAWLSYYPSVSRLQGKLIQVTKYGNPTYGAEPNKDETVKVPILILETPIRVRANPERSSNTESMTNVSFVQLIFPDDSDAMVKRHLDQNIVVTGTLAIGNRGGQFTEIVMTVKVVNPTGKPQ